MLESRWFLTMESQFGKKWDTYCGVDMAPEANRRLAADVKAGRRRLPSLAEYAAALGEYIERYNHRPHRGLNGAIPADVWAQRDENPVMDLGAIELRERANCKVFRQRVTLHGRRYKAPVLADVDGREVIVEYWLHNDKQVRVLDQQGRLLCTADLVNKSPYLPESRIEERRQRNLEARRQRAQRKLDEVNERARGALPHEAELGQLEARGALSKEADESIEHEPRIKLDLAPDFREMDEPDGARFVLSQAANGGPIDDEECI